VTSSLRFLGHKLCIFILFMKKNISGYVTWSEFPCDFFCKLYTCVSLLYMIYKKNHNNRGGKVLIYKGFKYQKNRERASAIYWRCWRQECRANLRTCTFNIEDESNRNLSFDQDLFHGSCIDISSIKWGTSGTCSSLLRVIEVRILWNSGMCSRSPPVQVLYIVGV
jgi:hypothetical protein